jgi:hypothetical protein
MGTYSVKVRAKKDSNWGIFQMRTSDALNGTYANLGGSKDMYASGPSFTEITIGNITFAASGTKGFKFLVKGKNTASSGYRLLFDYIKLSKL